MSSIATAVRKHSTLLLLLAFCIYAGLFIYRTSFVVDGRRYFSLFDDGMVSMRYARNLATGEGLVWNSNSEPVEGFTNLLWVLYMAAVHLLPIATEKISLVIQITSAALLLLNLLIVKRIAALVSNNSGLIVFAAMLLTAFYLPLNNWALQGMEVGLLALLISVAAFLALRSMETKIASWKMYLLLGIGTLVRPDMVVPYIAIWFFLMIAQREDRLWQAFIGCFMLVLFLGAQTAFRWFYFGDFLPNTYYLKMTGYPASLRIGHGLLVFLKFVARMNFALLVFPAMFWLARRDRRLMLLLTIVAAQCAYSVYVGGDAWESWGGSNRYISIVMPLFFVVFACGLGYLLIVWQRRLRRNGADFLSLKFQRQMVLSTTTLLVLSLICLNCIRGPRALAQWLLISKPLHVDDNRSVVEMSELIKRITKRNATVAVVWAGAPPYYMHRNAIDMLGKNDRTIAHEEMRLPPETANWWERLEFFYPGHLKYDYSYSIGQLKPDVVAQLWKQPEQAEALLVDSYQKIVVGNHKIFLRNDSPRILRKEIAKLAQVN